MKRIVFKLFPILNEECPKEWMEPNSLFQRVALFIMWVGFTLGAAASLIIYLFTKR